MAGIVKNVLGTSLLCHERSWNVAALQPRLFVCIVSAKKVQCKTKLEHGIACVLVLEFNQSGAFITKSWLRTSKMLKIETIAKISKFSGHFKYSRAYMRIGCYAPKILNQTWPKS